MKSVTPYLNFDGTCSEAMNFYNQCLGTQMHSMPFSDMPGDLPPETKNRVLHAALLDKSGPVLMASDTMPGHSLKPGNNAWVTIGCESLEEIERLFAALSAGGEVMMPLNDTFWGARFGMFKDKFGTQWMLNYDLPKK